MREEIKKSLDLGNVCYNSVHNILPCPLLSKYIKIKIYISIDILQPVVSNKCKTRSHIPGSEQRLRVFQKRVLSTIFGTKWMGIRRLKNLHNEKLDDLCFPSSIVRMINQGRWPGWSVRHGSRRREMRSVFWRGNLRGTGNVEAPNKWKDNMKKKL
jgi:hypothetical protein